jgi:serine/threonine-protein kinase
VAQHGDILNIQAELVDTATESQLWGEQFRAKASEVFTVQEEIAWQISESLRLKLTGEQKKKLRKRPTVNAEAYQEYLRGRYHWNNFSPESLRRARDHFQHAIELDPAYALAYAGLGDAFGAMAYYGFMPPAEGFPRAGAAARRAIALDDKVADAHVTLAIERLFWGWDWAAAEAEVQTAISLNPTLALAHSVYALVLSSSGRHDDALAEVRQACELDPLSLFVNMGVAWVHHFAGRPEAAAAEALKVREIVPGFEEAGNVLISAYETLEKYEEAAALISRQPCWGLMFDGAALAEAFRSNGREGYWAKRLEMMTLAAPTAPPVIHFAYATVHLHMGHLDEGLSHVEQMVEAHIGAAVFLQVDPAFRSLHGHPRFEALLNRVGAPRSPMASEPHTAST